MTFERAKVERKEYETQNYFSPFPCLTCIDIVIAIVGIASALI